jgi:hypothetical protein
VKVDLPLGDVVDRVTILRIKLARLSHEGQRANVRRELAALIGRWKDCQLREMDGLPEWTGLCEVNKQLWDVEDALRGHERRKDFGPAFIDLARSVYRLNDRRAALKRAINVELGSAFVEEKSYAPYDEDEPAPPTDPS